MSKTFLVLDIETVIDPELPVVSTGDVERLPAPPHHEIVVIGALPFDQDYEPRRIGVMSEAKDEAGILLDFARLLGERRP